MKSRPRRYRPVQLGGGWGLEAECVAVECSEPHEPWGSCGHWVLLPYRWPSIMGAELQARLWRARQQILLDASGPQRVRSHRRPAA